MRKDVDPLKTVPLIGHDDLSELVSVRDGASNRGPRPHEPHATQLGWAHGRGGPEATRRQLEAWVPRGTWEAFTTAVVGFGQLTQRGAVWRDEFVGFVERECGAGSEEAAAAVASADPSRVSWLGRARSVVAELHRLRLREFDSVNVYAK